MMQDCLAEGMDVIDNGSYERFCVERYLATSEWEEDELKTWCKSAE